MRRIILTLMGAALIAGSTSQVAFSKEHRHAYASPHLLPQAASDVSGDMRCAMKGMYADNDLNVYRDGQCRNDVDAHGG
jgi:hypothetical protein